MATDITFNARLEQRVSSKNGKPFWCVVLQLTQETEKLVFLESAEVELVKLTYGSGQKVKLSPNSSSES